MNTFPNLEPVHCSITGYNCCCLTFVQITQKTGKVVGIPISLRIFQFVVVYTVKGFSVVNEAKVDVFPEFSSFFYDQWMLAIWSLVLLPFSKSSLYIRKFLVQILLKPSLKDFERFFASMWNECNSVVVWTIFGIALLWNWNENGPFPPVNVVFWPITLPHKQNPKIRFRKTSYRVPHTPFQSVFPPKLQSLFPLLLP